MSLDSPTSETRNRRRLAMAAAAVVAVIGVAGVAFAISRDDKAPAPAAEPTVAPTTVAPRRETGVFPGAGFDDVPVTYTVPDGWENIGTGVTKGDPVFGVFLFNARDSYYTNVCASVGVDPPVGPTIDDLVSAWENLPGVDVTAASDVTIDGHVGKQIEFTVPGYPEEDCNGKFTRCSGSGLFAGHNFFRCSSLPENDIPGYPRYQQQKIWILRVDGTRFMIMAGSFPDTSQQDRAALDEIVASIQIG